MLWLKAFHIVFVIAWFAGLFYLPRLFVYHAQASDAVSLERFQVMERRLFALMTLAAVLALSFGLAMIVLLPDYLLQNWMLTKLALVALLVVYHLVCFRMLRQFRSSPHARSATFYRWFNELPTVLLIAIVILVVVRPGA